MTQSVIPTPEPPEPFVQELSSLLLPIEGATSFRPGSKPAAVALVLYRRGPDWHVPFVARRADLPSHPGQVGLPGGGVREGESAWAAAARETQEEIGVPAGELVPVGAGPPLYAAVSNYCVAPFVAWLPTRRVRFVHQASELDAVLEVPLSLLLDPRAWRETPEAWPGRHLPVDGAVIWGLTARILSDLLPPIAQAVRSVSASGAEGARGPGSPPA
jgi:8-oxo-dGTP pyrophosphatase MutT (NUDIX family)